MISECTRQIFVKYSDFIDSYGADDRFDRVPITRADWAKLAHSPYCHLSHWQSITETDWRIATSMDALTPTSGRHSMIFGPVTPGVYENVYSTDPFHYYSIGGGPARHDRLVKSAVCETLFVDGSSQKREDDAGL